MPRRAGGLRGRGRNPKASPQPRTTPPPSGVLEAGLHQQLLV